jgi:hypothetical protein
MGKAFGSQTACNVALTFASIALTFAPPSLTRGLVSTSATPKSFSPGPNIDCFAGDGAGVRRESLVFEAVDQQSTDGPDRGKPLRRPSPKQVPSCDLDAPRELSSTRKATRRSRSEPPAPVPAAEIGVIDLALSDDDVEHVAAPADDAGAGARGVGQTETGAGAWLGDGEGGRSLPPRTRQSTRRPTLVEPFERSLEVRGLIHCDF